MKSLDFYQLKSYSDWLNNHFQDARLQDVWTDGRILVFEFYRHQNQWLVLDLNPRAPFLFFFLEQPQISKHPKPLTLFLNSHGKNLHLRKFWVSPESGRVLYFELYSKNQSCEVEIRLIPKATNVLVHAAGKSIAWEKPKPLTTSHHGLTQEDSSLMAMTDDRVQSFGHEWLAGRTQQQKTKQSSSSNQDVFEKIKKDLAKKQNAILKIQEELDAHEEHRWQEWGEVLKYLKESPEKTPEKFQDLWDRHLSLSQNRERAFKKAKDLQRKRKGTEQRILILQQEVHEIEKRIQSGSVSELESISRKSVALDVLKKSASEARKKVFTDGFEAVIGKTGKDNLAILRQARAWDYWFHLRDYPGAHAILFRNKNQNVPDFVFADVANWIIQESIGKKQIPSGVKFDVVIAECRYVRPVKGAQGLVTYQNSRTFTFASK